MRRLTEADRVELAHYANGILHLGYDQDALDSIAYLAEAMPDDYHHLLDQMYARRMHVLNPGIIMEAK